MRYFYEKPNKYYAMYQNIYNCDHPVYNYCTLFLHKDKGLAVIQQRYVEIKKQTYWGPIDDYLVDSIYLHPYFKQLMDLRADLPINDIYPTMTIRQVMNYLKMKPLKKEIWETVFDRKHI